MQNDYLKYWRVVRYFIKIKYGISTGELDMLLFLYSEKYFGKANDFTISKIGKMNTFFANQLGLSSVGIANTKACLFTWVDDGTSTGWVAVGVNA